jgi:fructokinase
VTNSTTPRVIGLGEILWDVFGTQRRPGGAPANVAYHAGQMGAHSVVCSRVGVDPLGDELIALLSARSLTCDAVQRDPAHPTSTVTVELDHAEHPSYTIHEQVAWDFLAFTEDWSQRLAAADFVCFGTLAQRHAVARETIGRCLEAARRALLVYDINLRAPFYERSTIEASLAHANVVKLNEDEANLIGDMLEAPVKEPVDVARWLLDAKGCELVCITRGKDGCQLVSEDMVATIPGEPVQVVDAVGAGDAFTAGLIMGLARGWPLDQVGAFANRVGGLVASRSGAMPELRDEYAQLLESAT